MKRFRDTNYFVSEDGKIFNENKEISQSLMTRGYLSVSLFIEKGQRGKTFYVHRIVAETYIPNPLNKPLVNHENGNKLDCSVKNLIWATHKENSQHSVTVLRKEMGERHSRARVPDKIVSYIKKCKKNNLEPNYKRIAETYGVSIQHIKNIYKGRKRLIA